MNGFAIFAACALALATACSSDPDASAADAGAAESGAPGCTPYVDREAPFCDGIDCPKVGSINIRNPGVPRLGGGPLLCTATCDLATPNTCPANSKCASAGLNTPALCFPVCPCADLLQCVDGVCR